MFGTSGVRGPIGGTVTAELALSIGRAIAVEAETVVIGRDVRDSGRALLDALAAGLAESGVDILETGVATTPTIARAVAESEADAGIVVTASHNPPEDNGIKLWTASGMAFGSDDGRRIEDRIERSGYDLAEWDDHGRRREYATVTGTTATAAHRRAIVEAGERTLTSLGTTFEGTTVVVDLGNGTGRVTADALSDLGADVETLNGQRDGRFPSRPSEPTAETCGSLSAHVTAIGADLGIAHDGDADRMMAVAEDGQFVGGDSLLAIFGHEAVNAESGGDRVAAPVNTSLAVDDALDSVGGEVVRTRVGDVAVARETREDRVVLGGEPSGAWIFPGETPCPDGPLAAVRLTALSTAKSIGERLAETPTYPIRRGNIEVDDRSAVMNAVEEMVTEEYADVETLDGVRVETPEGWFLIRASGTQPLVRMTAEARDSETSQELLEEARSILENAIETV
ncbi:phosphoglucosamine mutase [Halopenitus sp. H-Gu1]|uniref:phosphoglucosamine mutase n=1 Tax=Halopenitus sp. H-Gu1 TaxID=3242697 RepID=UPI00359DCD6E